MEPEEGPTASRSLWCCRRCFLLSCSPVTSHTNWAGKAPGNPFSQPGERETGAQVEPRQGRGREGKEEVPWGLMPKGPSQCRD